MTEKLREEPGRNLSTALMLRGGARTFPMVCNVATEHAALDREFLKPPRLDIEG